MFGTVFDIEGDGLEATKFHVMSACADGDTISSTDDYDKMRLLLTEQPVVVGHNIARWDLPAAERVLEIKIPKDTLIIDTLALSWYLYPDRPKHDLESWGEELGVPKPEITDWFNLDFSVYRHRCETDVKINTLLWKKQYKYLKEIYGSHEKVLAFLRYLAFKMDCAREQEQSRWKLDVERCKASLQKLEKLREEKFNELKGAMPPVPIRSVSNPPARPLKADGTLSAAGERWEALKREHGLPEDYVGPIETIRGYDEPNPGSSPQIKQWLDSLGWVPQTFKTNKRGVDVPQINKQKQDGGGVCESVKKLIEKEPAIEVLDNFFVLGHRIGILNGFLASVSPDGYVSARVQGLTNTLRFKHAEVVNLPKIDAPFGDDIRGALIAPEGYELCGSDMSSLEDRTKQHFMWNYDPEYVKEMQTPDFDPHIDIAVVGGLMSKVDAEFYKKFQPSIASHDEHTRYKLLKTIRGIAKNTNYACVYGAGPPKIAKTAGISVEEAGTLHSAYWSRNWSVRAVANSLRTKTVQGSKWLYNPVSTFWYSLRHDKDRFSTLNQGTGVFCFDTWVAVVRRDRPQLTGQFHDEIVLCVKQGHREEITSWLKETIEEVNEILTLNRRLDIDVQFGSRYSEIH